MKIYNRFLSVLLCCSVLFLFNCQQEEVDVTEDVGIQFDLSSSMVSGAENGRLNDEFPTVDPGDCDLALAAYAKVEIDGEESHHLAINQWGESYKTNLLELSPGSYEVTKFIVYSEDDEALFATPVAGSEFEKFVNNPLPLTFTIDNYEKVEYDVEVLCVEGFTPPEFGFSFWNIDLKQTKQLCLFANYCDAVQGHAVAAIQAYVFSSHEENQEDLIYQSSADGAGDLLCLRMPFDSDTELQEQNYWVVLMINDNKFAGWINLAMVDEINQEKGYLHLNENCEGNYGPFNKEFTVTINNVFQPKPFFMAGVFNTPENSDAAGPAFPNDSYQFEFHAPPGSLLSTAFMYVQSNDLFFATPANGLPLFNPDGMPISGDITSEFILYDAGTEVNQEPGLGPDQAPRQAGPDTGMDENGVVQPIAEVMDGFTYPAVENAIQVTITAGDANMFTLLIENVSGGSAQPSPLSPGAWVVHNDEVQLFTVGASASEGLEDIAEDGNPTVLGEFLHSNSGLVSPISPGAFAVHSSGVMPIFVSGQPALGNGLEEIAEDGMPAIMNSYLSSAPGVITHGIIVPDPAGPVFPGESVSFSFYANEGYLNFATMLIQSNDYFFAFHDSGVSLFDDFGNPMTGDVTPYVNLWDASTEVDQFPGVGPDQAPRQSGPDTGADENGNVEQVHHQFIPPVEEMVQVIIE